MSEVHPDTTPETGGEDHAATSADPRLLWGIVAGALLGVLVGGFLPGLGAATEIIGQMFLNLLMALVVPLVVLSIITGITNLGTIDRLGSLGLRAFLYYAMTTALAVGIGIVVVNLVRPGIGVDAGLEAGGAGSQQEAGGAQRPLAEPEADGAATAVGAGNAGIGEVLERLLVGNSDTGEQGLIPRNLFLAMARAEILPLILFSLLAGTALALAGPSARTAVRVVCELNDVVMTLVNWVMWLAPAGIFALLAARIAAAGGLRGFLPELQALGWYTGTVILGLAVHALVVLPLILWLITGRRPLRYARGLGSALATAFSTASSSATLPLTLRGVTRENGVRTRAASFVLPLGATINMDGTALYESVAAIFIAQVYGVPLDLGTQVVIFLTATLAAIGAAGIPEAGLVTMVIVLTAAGLPLEGVGLILAVDWILDRFRTTINVWGDGVGAAVIDRFEPA